MKNIVFGTLGLIGAGGLFYLLKTQANMSNRNSFIAVASLSSVIIGTTGLTFSVASQIDAAKKKKDDKVPPVPNPTPAPTTVKPTPANPNPNPSTNTPTKTPPTVSTTQALSDLTTFLINGINKNKST